ncbi:MAG: 23S rRNA (guanosine(2251)-2'-O)-methyltransferase RlmB [Treponema sp.]|nr:23S rRNA (guanosine(2251)-2'-O)-methyltransferase RlmB [Treponema sp.]
MGYLSGFHAIEERIKSGIPCGPLLVAKPGPRARELVDIALACRIRVDRVGTADLDRLVPDHRGIILETTDNSASSGIVTLEDFLITLGDRQNALVLILDEITDPHNYGAILRSCDQFDVDLVISRRRRNAKNAPVIAQTSAGASAWVKCAEEGNLARAVELLKENNFWVYGADMNGQKVYNLELSGRIALIMGGEAGLSRLLHERCDDIAAIPTQGRIDSLNVSVAAGILLYEVTRQRYCSSRQKSKGSEKKPNNKQEP